MITPIVERHDISGVTAVRVKTIKKHGEKYWKSEAKVLFIRDVLTDYTASLGGEFEVVIHYPPEGFDYGNPKCWITVYYKGVWTQGTFKKVNK